MTDIVQCMCETGTGPQLQLHVTGTFILWRMVRDRFVYLDKKGFSHPKEIQRGLYILYILDSFSAFS